MCPPVICIRALVGIMALWGYSMLVLNDIGGFKPTWTGTGNQTLQQRPRRQFETESSRVPYLEHAGEIFKILRGSLGRCGNRGQTGSTEYLPTGKIGKIHFYRHRVAEKEEIHTPPLFQDNLYDISSKHNNMTSVAIPIRYQPEIPTVC